jgi:hypothetical protein
LPTGRLGRLAHVLAAEVLDHEALPPDERAAPGSGRRVAVADGVERVAQQPVEPGPPLDRADGVLRRPLGTQGVDPLAHDPRGARRVAALERQVGQLDGDLGGRLALVARAQEERLGAIDEPGVDVAARELEVDVGVTHLDLGAGEAASRLLEPPLEVVGLGVGRGVALGIEPQPQPHEVELDQLRGDLPLEVAGRGVGVEHRLRLLQPPDGEEVG